MKTKFTFLFLSAIFLSFTLKAVTPDPLIITHNDGITNVGGVGGGCNATYMQDPDNTFSQDTVLKFERTSSAASWEGVYWYGGAFNNSNGVSVGITDAASQYKYLVIKAKQGSTQPFKIALKQTVGDANATTPDIVSSNVAIANKWQNYYFLLSGSGTPNTFLQMVVMPEQGNAICTDYLNEIYFTNNELITQTPPTPTYSRTATTIDLIWTAVSGATSYKIVDATTGGTIKDNITGLSATITGLSTNTAYSYCLIAKNGIIETQLSNPVNVITRKEKGSSYELIENFEGTIDEGWTNAGGCTITIPNSNDIKNGINTSANCAKVDISTFNVFYSGIQNNNERIDVGPNAPFNYLHVKMHRNQDDGKFGLTLIARDDISQPQLNIDLDYTSEMTDGIWHDYIFDLKNASATDLSYFKFYLRTNFGNNTGDPNYFATTATSTYIDDLILDNSAGITTVIFPRVKMELVVMVKEKYIQTLCDVQNIDIYSSTGLLINNFINQPKGTKINLNSGFYIVKAKVNENEISQKIIIR